jgi:hypothetical protein
VHRQAAPPGACRQPCADDGAYGAPEVGGDWRRGRSVVPWREAAHMVPELRMTARTCPEILTLLATAGPA